MPHSHCEIAFKILQVKTCSMNKRQSQYFVSAIFIKIVVIIGSYYIFFNSLAHTSPWSQAALGVKVSSSSAKVLLISLGSIVMFFSMSELKHATINLWFYLFKVQNRPLI